MGSHYHYTPSELDILEKLNTGVLENRIASSLFSETDLHQFHKGKEEQRTYTTSLVQNKGQNIWSTAEKKISYQPTETENICSSTEERLSYQPTETKEQTILSKHKTEHPKQRIHDRLSIPKQIYSSDLINLRPKGFEGIKELAARTYYDSQIDSSICNLPQSGTEYNCIRDIILNQNQSEYKQSELDEPVTRKYNKDYWQSYASAMGFVDDKKLRDKSLNDTMRNSPQHSKSPIDETSKVKQPQSLTSEFDYIQHEPTLLNQTVRYIKSPKTRLPKRRHTCPILRGVPRENRNCEIDAKTNAETRSTQPQEGRTKDQLTTHTCRRSHSDEKCVTDKEALKKLTEGKSDHIHPKTVTDHISISENPKSQGKYALAQEFEKDNYHLIWNTETDICSSNEPEEGKPFGVDLKHVVTPERKDSSASEKEYRKRPVLSLIKMFDVNDH